MGEIIDLLHDESRRAPPVRRLDALCDRFEAAWAAGQRPRIEEELADIPESERPALLRMLLVLELEVRQGQSEQPTPREYQERFPGYVALVEDVFAEAAIPHGWRAHKAVATTAPPVHTSPPGKSPDGTLGIHDFVKSASDRTRCFRSPCGGRARYRSSRGVARHFEVNAVPTGGHTRGQCGLDRGAHFRARLPAIPATRAPLGCPDHPGPEASVMCLT